MELSAHGILANYFSRLGTYFRCGGDSLTIFLGSSASIAKRIWLSAIEILSDILVRDLQKLREPVLTGAVHILIASSHLLTDQRTTFYYLLSGVLSVLVKL